MPSLTEPEYGDTWQFRGSGEDVLIFLHGKRKDRLMTVWLRVFENSRLKPTIINMLSWPSEGWRRLDDD